jgi:hypothetical protein
MASILPTLAEVEREHILATLDGCGGNRTRAAQLLDISVRCLRNKLRQYRASGVIVPKRNTCGMTSKTVPNLGTCFSGDCKDTDERDQ